MCLSAWPVQGRRWDEMCRIHANGWRMRDTPNSWAMVRNRAASDKAQASIVPRTDFTDIAYAAILDMRASPCDFPHGRGAGPFANHK